MGRLIRILLWIAGSLAVTLIIAAFAVYGLSEYRLQQSYSSLHDANFAASDGDPIEGRRLARVYGCTDCHGPDLTGRLMEEDPWVITVVSPNLTLSMPDYTDAQFASAVRKGIRKDGTGISIMPTSKFQWLLDSELAGMLAYLRTLRERGHIQPPTTFGPIGRIGLALGEIETGPRSRAAVGKAGPATLPGYEQSRRLAMATCGECHTTMLTGGGFLDTPDLSIAAAYSLEDFRLLLRSGLATGGRELREMSNTARIRYSHLTDEEIDGLHSYLVARAQSVPPH